MAYKTVWARPSILHVLAIPKKQETHLPNKAMYKC